MSRPPTDAEYADFVASAWGPLYRTAYLMVGDRALAEDLVQTALTNTYASWHRVRELGAAYGYARTALVRSRATWLRSRSRRPEQLTDRPPERPVIEDPEGTVKSQTSVALVKLRFLLGDSVVPLETTGGPP